MKYDIFISYRREGGDTQARLIFERLQKKGYQVFLDIESLSSGKFNEKLLNKIEECTDVIVILPPGAMERCNNPDDWLYRELTHAMKYRKNIIPVIMKGFEWPNEMPEELRDVQNYNGILDSKEYFDAAFEKLTSLLQCKPDMFAKLKKNRKNHNKSITTILKRRKNFFIIGILFILLGGMAYGGVSFWKYQKAQEDAENVSIRLTVDEEMSVADYYDAIPILKNRLDILAGGEKYKIDVKDDVIEIAMPLDVFCGENINDILKGYITRPIELSINDKIAISSEDIQSIEIANGHKEEIDLTLYDLADVEDYNYMIITFTDDFEEKIEEIYGAERDKIGIYQDSQFSNFYYYLLTPAKDKNAYYIVNNHQDAKFSELLKYTYTHESFSEAFNVNILMPVIWENVNSADIKGENQCNVENLKEGQTTAQYREGYLAEDDMTSGEWQDTITVIKRRLDTIGVPYAFGYTVSESRGITIKIETDKINEELLSMICKSNALDIKNAFYQLASLRNIKSLDYSPMGNGKYQFSFSVDDEWYYREQWESAASGIFIGGRDKTIYIEEDYSDVILSGSELAASTDAIEDIRFTNLMGFGLEEIDEEHVYLLDFLKDFIENADLPSNANYSLSRCRNDDSNNTYGLSDIDNILKDKRAEMEAEIKKEVSSQAELIWDNTKVLINLNLEPADNLPEIMNEAVQKIYKICNLKDGDIRDCTIYYGSSSVKDYVMCNIYSSIYDIHGLTYYFYCQGELYEFYKDELKRIIDSDSFYNNKVEKGANGGFQEE